MLARLRSTPLVRTAPALARTQLLPSLAVRSLRMSAPAQSSVPTVTTSSGNGEHPAVENNQTFVPCCAALPTL